MTQIMDNTISNDTQEEVITPDEETHETDNEVEEITETPTIDDYNRLVKENQTLKAQKEHFKKKAGAIKEAPAKTETSSDNFMSREEAVLIANGYDLEDLDQLKAIQKGMGLKSFKEAMETPLFKSFHKDKKAEQKRKDASLGASGGSGSSETKAKPNMSEEEHKELWNKHYQK